MKVDDEVEELLPEKDLSDYLPKWCVRWRRREQDLLPRSFSSAGMESPSEGVRSRPAPGGFSRRVGCPFLRICGLWRRAVPRVFLTPGVATPASSSLCRFGYSAVYVVSAIPVFITLAALSLLFVSSLK